MQKDHFEFLDGLRGAAAAIVLLLHVLQQARADIFPYAGLAVDFFYVLSGFVVAHAYEARLIDGTITFGSFAIVRFRRLYPLVFISTAAGIVLALGAAIVRHDIAVADVLKAGALALLLMPSFVFPQWATAYPFNFAAWSLTFEAVANAAYALVARRLSNPMLFGVLIVSAALLALNAISLGYVSGGYDQSNFWHGFTRVPYPFFVGVLASRFRPRNAILPAWLIVACLAAALLLPLAATPARSLSMVMVLFPLLVWAGSANRLGRRSSSLCRMAGALSYPVYICQAPILRVGLELREMLAPHGLPDAIFSTTEFVVVVTLGWVAWRWFDAPIQRAFRRKGPAAKA